MKGSCFYKKSKGQHDDRDAWLRRVADNWGVLQFAPDHLREDREGGDCGLYSFFPLP